MKLDEVLIIDRSSVGAKKRQIKYGNLSVYLKKNQPLMYFIG